MLCGELLHFTERFLSIRRPLVRAHNKLWFLASVFLSSSRTHTRSRPIPFLPRVSRTRAGTWRSVITHPASQRHLQEVPRVEVPGDISWQQLTHADVWGCEEPRRAPWGGLVPGRCCRSQRNSWSIRDCFLQQISPHDPVMQILFSSARNTSAEMNACCVTRQPRY